MRQITENIGKYMLGKYLGSFAGFVNESFHQLCGQFPIFTEDHLVAAIFHAFPDTGYPIMTNVGEHKAFHVFLKKPTPDAPEFFNIPIHSTVIPELQVDCTALVDMDWLDKKIKPKLGHTEFKNLQDIKPVSQYTLRDICRVVNCGQVVSLVTNVVKQFILTLDQSDEFEKFAGKTCQVTDGVLDAVNNYFYEMIATVSVMDQSIFEDKQYGPLMNLALEAPADPLETGIYRIPIDEIEVQLTGIVLANP